MLQISGNKFETIKRTQVEKTISVHPSIFFKQIRSIACNAQHSFGAEFDFEKEKLTLRFMKNM